jgi:hypothetical protein
MAQQLSCDICGDEAAAVMLTNLDTGDVQAFGGACLPVFFGHASAAAMDAGVHKGLPQKCQTCRRIHERMTLAAKPDDVSRETPAEAVAATDEPGQAVDAG